MGRILVIHPRLGLLDLVQRVLTGRHEVVVFDKYEPALERISSNGEYEAVLCSLEEFGRTTEIFEKMSEHSPRAQLMAVMACWWSPDRWRARPHRTFPPIGPNRA